MDAKIVRVGIISKTSEKIVMTNFKQQEHALIPMRNVGPIKVKSEQVTGLISVPMATYESPLWPSIDRGARVSRQIETGISAVLLSDCMTRSVILETQNIINAVKLKNFIATSFDTLQALVAKQSGYATLLSVDVKLVSRLVYIRFAINSADASGHNMATKASEYCLNWLLENFVDARYVSISGNYCTDKKVSAVNSILGRGKNVIADLLIPREIVVKDLRSTPEAIVDLNIKKNLIGSTVAGSLMSSNAHFANMLLAFYLATGQDAANIIEASQGITYAEVLNGDLYFSVNLPNLIMGTKGNGKDLPFVEENLKLLDCASQNVLPGVNAQRLAIICAASVLCGELSLLAAQTNPGELMKTHILLERRKRK